MLRPFVTLALLLGLASPAFSQLSAPPAKAKAPAAPKGKEKAKDAPAEEKTKTEFATFGGGCFWCLEAVFERIPGVKSVVSGYSGGYIAKPSYEMVCTGQTGHAEVVQIEYDRRS